MKLLCTGIILALGLHSLPVMADEAPKDMHQFNVECPAQRLLPILDVAYHECHNGFVKTGGSCPKFLEVMKELLPNYDCQRAFDATSTQNFIVPAVWLAGDGALEDYVRLIWQMASGKDKMFRNPVFRNSVSNAKVLFGSAEFRQILDGALAEEYVERSKAIERANGKK